MKIKIKEKSTKNIILEKCGFYPKDETFSDVILGVFGGWESLKEYCKKMLCSEDFSYLKAGLKLEMSTDPFITLTDPNNEFSYLWDTLKKERELKKFKDLTKEMDVEDITEVENNFNKVKNFLLVSSPLTSFSILSNDFSPTELLLFLETNKGDIKGTITSILCWNNPENRRIALRKLVKGVTRK